MRSRAARWPIAQNARLLVEVGSQAGPIDEVPMCSLHVLGVTEQSGLIGLRSCDPLVVVLQSLTVPIVHGPL